MRQLGLLALYIALAIGVVFVLGTSLGGMAPLGRLVDPVDGLYHTARHAEHGPVSQGTLSALEQPVTVLRDDRGVPHIFAASDRDALRAFGYVVAQDRLFQIDFIMRAGSGRLAEALGPAAVGSDRFLRQVGMDWGARRNATRIRRHPEVAWDVITWFGEGVNAYIDGLKERDLPFEFRLLGYRPERYALLHATRLLQYMVYDLTYQADEAAYGQLHDRLKENDFQALYPRFARLFVPIVPEPGGQVPANANRPLYYSLTPEARAAAETLERRALQAQQRGTVLEGFVAGKGSNNWAVDGSRSTTGAPILAGDMHLALSLPAIWYEVHLVTPEMNVYGVTVPGAPLPVEAFNDYLGWTFTNTGADQIDHLALELDATGTKYRFEGEFRDLETVLDTIYVRGGAPVVDTLYYSHWGPVAKGDTGAVAVRWVGHEPNRALEALWHMNHAAGFDAFQEALRSWDAPMQNILYADLYGNIAIRSTGFLPLRGGVPGEGLLDGTSEAASWTGRVPFEALPFSYNPAQGFLTSTNQQPTDSTYRYYLARDWADAYRSLRIDSLLRRKPRHSVDDLKRYQADVHAVQRDLFVPLLDTLRGLTPRADTLRRMLVAWDGTTSVDRPEPLVLDTFLDALGRLAWDEPVFVGVPKPQESQLFLLLQRQPLSAWLDVQATSVREDAAGLLRLALDATAETMVRRHGRNLAAWRWGDHHQIVFRHLTRSEALRPLWRGPVAYPGFRATLSPAGSRMTTHSASWRVVVDFSQAPPVGYGVYPGGQSGNPFSRFYDLHLPVYWSFEHYRLLKPRTPGQLDEARISSRLILLPVGG